MVVTEEEYQKCRSSHPFFYSNNGDTIFKLERPGLFYFISGVSGHCERGQKMIIKVLEPPANSPEQPQNQTTTDENNNGSVLSPSMASAINIVLLVLSFLWLPFHQASLTRLIHFSLFLFVIHVIVRSVSLESFVEIIVGIHDQIKINYLLSHSLRGLLLKSTRKSNA